MGWSSSRSVDQSVVNDTLNLFAFPRKIIRLSGSFRQLWRRHKGISPSSLSSGVERNFAGGCAIRSRA
jgi:hypothetical protein